VSPAPFDRCMVLPLPARTDGDVAVQEVIALAGDFLCRELTTRLGRVADEGRRTPLVVDRQTPPTSRLAPA